MHPYPHQYTVEARAEVAGDVEVAGQGLPALLTAPPAEFGGPGDRWSPETLLCAAVADCFVLSFRSVARASRLDWTSLDCNVAGTLDRVEGTSRFTEMVVTATLRVPAGTDQERANRLMAKAEHVCLISNSLVAERRLVPTVVVG
ncbi:MAG TPA: OsmC family protein [Steroidobacteraceae bacterium]|nr:OsmC family protein [Steroidobacteraceae bacterium]